MSTTPQSTLARPVASSDADLIDLLAAHLGGAAPRWREESALACPICLALGFAGLPSDQARARDPERFDALIALAARYDSWTRDVPTTPRRLCWGCRRAAAVLAEEGGAA